MKLLYCIIALTISAMLFSAGIIDRGQPAKPLHITYPEYFGNRVFIPEDNTTTEEGVYLGRLLFYERSLSTTNLISCATCHQQQFAFTDGKTFSKGVDGFVQPRNTMSLVNLLWVQNFFWDGRAKGLEAQAVTPLTDVHEMGQSLETSAKKLQKNKMYPALFRKAFGTDSITGTHIVYALAQFERTLVSANSKYDQYLQGTYKPTASELNGINLFYSNANTEKNIRGAACAHCHSGPKTYNELFHNNGIDSIAFDNGREKITGQPLDKGRFRVVSLRNIALTAPYMHDGRFRTLEQVLDHYNEHVKQSPTLSIFLQNNSNDKDGTTLGLTQQEKKDVIAFLNMLTDSSFVNNKQFSNPFKY